MYSVSQGEIEWAIDQGCAHVMGLEKRGMTDIYISLLFKIKLLINETKFGSRFVAQKIYTNKLQSRSTHQSNT